MGVVHGAVPVRHINLGKSTDLSSRTLSRAEEVLDTESLWRLRSEQSVSAGEEVEPWIVPLATAIQAATKSTEITRRGKQEVSTGR